MKNTFMAINQKSTPTLRFKDQQGNDYPDWKKKSIGKIGEIIGGGTPATNQNRFWNGNINWFTPSEIKSKYSNSSIRKISEQGLAQSSAKLLPVGTILLTSRATIGEVSIAREECTTNQGFQSCVVNSSSYSNEYTYYWIVKNKILFLRIANGSTYLEVTNSEIKKILFDAPNLKEQHKIASFLASVDTKIEQLGKKKELLELYKKGMMQKLFSQEVRFKDEQRNEYPDWEEKLLGDISNLSKGKGISKTDVKVDGTVKCIRYGELYTRYGETISNVLSSTNVPISELVLSQKNDVIIPASGETALDIASAACITVEGVAVGGDINIIRCQQNGIFLAYYLISKKIDIARLAQGVSIIHLYSAQLASLSLRIPSKQEQQKIANFLSAIDKKIELVAEQLEQARTFKKGLLQRMFI